MSKVICDICGTSYADNATQCPICGCVRTAEAVVVEDTASENNGYTYVKGGRFSRANVRKRNQMAAAAMKVKKVSAEKNEDENANTTTGNKRRGLIIVLACLLLVVVSMFIYIGVTISNQNPSQTGADTTPAEISCTQIVLSSLDVTMTQKGEVYKLEVTCTPADTTDQVTFSENSGGKIVQVDQSGNVTCVDSGKAVITVICGDLKKECRVTCTIEEVTEPAVTEPQISVRFMRYNV